MQKSGIGDKPLAAQAPRWRTYRIGQKFRSEGADPIPGRADNAAAVGIDLFALRVVCRKIAFGDQSESNIAG